ncbi:MAG: glutathione S-transferase N-terminal domain-containing protein [Deltaproteobacteria bacterium]|nr:glutathione S-transferase N-terminal domain-containing protein [Deltaproteobacteria bacterium]
MTYVLHGARGSGSSIIEAACAELRLPVELRDLDARGGEHRGDAYARLNPVRKLPTLVIDGTEVLTETVAILVTLDERHRIGGLLPAPGTPTRAQALRWLLVLATDLYPVMELVDHPERFAPVGTDAAALGERSKGAMARALGEHRGCDRRCAVVLVRGVLGRRPLHHRAEPLGHDRRVASRAPTAGGSARDRNTLARSGGRCARTALRPGRAAVDRPRPRSKQRVDVDAPLSPARRATAGTMLRPRWVLCSTAPPDEHGRATCGLADRRGRRCARRRGRVLAGVVVDRAGPRAGDLAGPGRRRRARG